MEQGRNEVGQFSAKGEERREVRREERTGEMRGQERREDRREKETREREKSPAPSKIQTHDLLITRRVLCRGPSI